MKFNCCAELCKSGYHSFGDAELYQKPLEFDWNYEEMKDLNDAVFISLFNAAYQKCFGVPLSAVASETESKHLSNKIFEATGLVIGAKSLKNYSQYITEDNNDKSENPSVATLDTLARYVLGAPYTTEILRKDNESHYPYWFKYKGNIAVPSRKALRPVVIKRPVLTWIVIIAITIIIIAAIAILFFRNTTGNFRESFHNVNEDTLLRHGWQIKNKDTTWWAKRNDKPGLLTLYTLRGDNWADSANAPLIKNMLIRKLPTDCFEAEIHFENFIPKQKWQQAGILLLEDTTLKSKSVRLSLAFNDFFGGFKHPAEIIVQAISSNNIDLSKPEEIAHIPLLTFQQGKEQLIDQNLQKSALRLEKNGNHFRFLCSNGSGENFAYREVLSKDLDIKPKYIAIFALQGFVNGTNVPVRVKLFSVNGVPCKN